MARYSNPRSSSGNYGDDDNNVSSQGRYYGSPRNVSNDDYDYEMRYGHSGLERNNQSGGKYGQDYDRQNYGVDERNRPYGQNYARGDYEREGSRQARRDFDYGNSYDSDYGDDRPLRRRNSNDY